MSVRKLTVVLAGLFALSAVFGVPLAAQDRPDSAAPPDVSASAAAQTKAPDQGQDQDSEPADSQLAGTVRAPDGTTVPGATLRVIQTTTGKAWITWSADDGKYEFPALPAGHFRVETSQLGFAPSTQEVNLDSGKQTPMDVQVSVATLAALTAPPPAETAPKPPVEAQSANTAPPPGNGTPAPGSNQNRPQGTAQARNSSSQGQGPGAGQRGAGGRNGQGGQGGGGGGQGRRSFQQLGLNGLGQNQAEQSPEEQALAESGPQLGQAASADAVQMIGTVAMGQIPAGGFPEAGPGGQGLPGGMPGQGPPGMGGPGGPGGGPGGPGGFAGGPPGGFGGGGGGGGRGGGGRGRGGQGPQGGPQGVASLWGVERLNRQRINRIHFSIYDTYGNSALNARPDSLYQANPPKISSWTESAGMNIGGPLKIPHIYDGTDKTFFYINFGGTWSRTPIDQFAAVPTQAEREGIFNNVMLYNPATGTPFPGCPQACSILPATLTPQEQVAQNLLAFIPEPNITPTNVGSQNYNFHLQTNVPGVSNRLNVNVTHQISSKLSANVNYNLSDSTSHSINNYPGLEGNTLTRGQSLVLGLTQNWTKTFMHTSQLYFSRNRTRGTGEFTDLNDIASELGINGISPAPIEYGLPSINLTNFTSLSGPYFTLARSQTWRYVDSFRWMKAKHTISAGWEIRKMDIDRDTDPVPNGQFAFTGAQTSFNPTNGTCDPSLPSIPCGSDFADFLLGYPANAKVQSGDTATYFHNWGFVGYASDDWHMFPKFTLTYGLRYEAFTPPTEINGHIANLENLSDPTCYTPNPVYVNGALACTVSPTASLFYGHYKNFAPRLGIAWQPPGKWFSGNHQMTVRAGFSMFYVESYLNTLAAEMANQPPFATANTLTQQSVAVPPLTLTTPLSLAQPGIVTNTVAVNPNYQVPYAMIWNFGIEYNLARATFLEVMYTGTRGVHLDELLGFSTVTNGAAHAAGFTYDTTGAFSNLNALQVRLQRRMTRGLMFMARYTYSKSLDDASTIGGSSQTVLQDNADPRLDYGLSTFNMTHQFLGMFTYQLPFGERQRFAGKGWQKDVFGAWRVNASATVNSGTPYTVRVFSTNPSCQNVPGINSERANQSGSAALSNPTVGEWFNTSVFTEPTSCFGDAPRNSVIGPGVFTINSGLTKTVQFGRDGLRRLDFTWNASNLLNHPNYSGLSTVLNSKTFGEITTVGAMRSMTFTTRLNF